MKAALTEYMEGDSPTDRLVVECVDASNGHEEGEVVACLRYLYHERGLRPDALHGPDRWAWFPVVIQDYFDRKDARRESAHPEGWNGWADRNDAKERRALDTMTAGIELPDAGGPTR